MSHSDTYVSGGHRHWPYAQTDICDVYQFGTFNIVGLMEGTMCVFAHPIDPQWWSFQAAGRSPLAPMVGRVPGSLTDQRSSCARWGCACSTRTPAWWWRLGLETPNSQRCQISDEEIKCHKQNAKLWIEMYIHLPMTMLSQHHSFTKQTVDWISNKFICYQWAYYFFKYLAYGITF